MDVGMAFQQGSCCWNAYDIHLGVRDTSFHFLNQGKSQNQIPSEGRLNNEDGGHAVVEGWFAE